MDRQTVIARKDGIITALMDGNAVSMSVENGRYYSFNGTASAIWRHLDAPITVGEMVEKLADEYSIEEDVCREAVIEYLIKLEGEKLMIARQP
jgi:hypothetical protein